MPKCRRLDAPARVDNHLFVLEKRQNAVDRISQEVQPRLLLKSEERRVKELFEISPRVCETV